MKIDKYLVAIVPPQKIAEEIRELKEFCREKYNTKGALNSPAHITMHMPFEWRSDRESKLIDDISKFASSRKSFEVQLAGFDSFPPRVIFIAVKENTVMNECQRDLHKFFKTELNIFNADYGDRSFHPHVTVAFRDLKKDMFQAAWEEFKDRTFEASFVCENLTVLKHDGHYWQPIAGAKFSGH